MKQTVIYIDKRVDHVVDFEGDSTDVRSYVTKNNLQGEQELFRFYTDRDNCIFVQWKSLQRVLLKSIRETEVKESAPVQEDILEELVSDLSPEPAESHNTKQVPAEHMYRYKVELDFADYDSKHTKNNVEAQTTADNAIQFAASVTDEVEKYKYFKLCRKGKDVGKHQTEIEFVFSYNGTTAASVYLFCAPDQCISDAVLDFGSEASQMSLNSRDKQWRNSALVSLFSNMYSTVTAKQEHGGDATADTPSDYDQYDNDAKKLFRSVFFAKRNITEQELANNPVTPVLHQANQVLSILTRTQDTQSNTDYLQTPNVKLLSFGGIDEPLINGTTPLSEYEDDYFYRASLNTFILNALYSAKKSNRRISAMTLYLLMPNVYDQNSVFNRLATLRSDLREICLKNEAELSCIKHIEVASLSESDASLLGALSILAESNNSTFAPDGNYLVLDAGKGTLDYSVINVNASRPEHYHGVYRGGIVGAGSALSTAYTMAMLYDYVKVCNISDVTTRDLIMVICNKLLGLSDSTRRGENAGEMVKLNRLMRAVERYKKADNDPTTYTRMSKQPYSVENPITSLDDIKIDSLIDYAEKQVSENAYYPLSTTARGYVTCAIDIICNNVIEDLKGVLPYLNHESTYPVDRVLFAGRAFMQKDFKETMNKMLEGEKLIPPSDSEVNYKTLNSEAKEKSICLFVSPVLNRGWYDSFRASLFRQRSKPKETEKNLQDRLAGSTMGRLFGGGNKQEENLNLSDLLVVLGGSGEIHSKSAKSSRYMAYGVDVNIENSFDRILVGGSRFRSNVTGAQTIFFTSHNIVTRDQRGEAHIIESPVINLNTSPLVLATQFPFISVETPTENMLNSFLMVFGSNDLSRQGQQGQKEQKSQEQQKQQEQKQQEQRGQEEKQEQRGQQKEEKQETSGNDVASKKKYNQDLDDLLDDM